MFQCAAVSLFLHVPVIPTLRVVPSLLLMHAWTAFESLLPALGHAGSATANEIAVKSDVPAISQWLIQHLLRIGSTAPGSAGPTIRVWRAMVLIQMSAVNTKSFAYLSSSVAQSWERHQRGKN